MERSSVYVVNVLPQNVVLVSSWLGTLTDNTVVNAVSIRFRDIWVEVRRRAAGRTKGEASLGDLRSSIAK